MELVATAHRCVKRVEEPGVARARQQLQATLQHFFNKTANAFAATIRNLQETNR